MVDKSACVNNSIGAMKKKENEVSCWNCLKIEDYDRDDTPTTLNEIRIDSRHKYKLYSLFVSDLTKPKTVPLSQKVSEHYVIGKQLETKIITDCKINKVNSEISNRKSEEKNNVLNVTNKIYEKQTVINECVGSVVIVHKTHLENPTLNKKSEAHKIERNNKSNVSKTEDDVENITKGIENISLDNTKRDPLNVKTNQDCSGFLHTGLIVKNYPIKTEVTNNESNSVEISYPTIEAKDKCAMKNMEEISYNSAQLSPLAPSFKVNKIDSDNKNIETKDSNASNNSYSFLDFPNTSLYNENNASMAGKQKDVKFSDFDSDHESTSYFTDDVDMTHMNVGDLKKDVVLRINDINVTTHNKENTAIRKSNNETDTSSPLSNNKQNIYGTASVDNLKNIIFCETKNNMKMINSNNIVNITTSLLENNVTSNKILDSNIDTKESDNAQLLLTHVIENKNCEVNLNLNEVKSTKDSFATSNFDSSNSSSFNKCHFEIPIKDLNDIKFTVASDELNSLNRIQLDDKGKTNLEKSDLNTPSPLLSEGEIFVADKLDNNSFTGSESGYAGSSMKDFNDLENMNQGIQSKSAHTSSTSGLDKVSPSTKKRRSLNSFIPIPVTVRKRNLASSESLNAVVRSPEKKSLNPTRRSTLGLIQKPRISVGTLSFFFSSSNQLLVFTETEHFESNSTIIYTAIIFFRHL